MSTAKHLFRLALNLRVECQKHEVFLHVFRISCERMIATGVDGRSQGDFDAGVSLGHDIRNFIPLDKGAFEIEGRCLAGWVRSWMGSDYSPPLEPIGWFWKGHKPGTHLLMGTTSSGSTSGTETIGAIQAQATAFSDSCVSLSAFVVAKKMEEKIRKGNGYLVYITFWICMA